MDNFSKGFISKCAELGMNEDQSAGLYKFADEAAGAGWQDAAKDYMNSYGGYGAGGAVLGGLLGALFNKKDRLRGALMGALAGGAGGAGLYAHNKAMDQVAANAAAAESRHKNSIATLQRAADDAVAIANERYKKLQDDSAAELDAERARSREALADKARREADLRNKIDAQRDALNRLGGDGGLRDLMLNSARLYPAMVKDNVLPDFNDAAAISEFEKQLEGLRMSGIEGLDPFITAATNADARGKALEDARLGRVAAREQEAADARAWLEATRLADAEKAWNSLRPEQAAAIKYLFQHRTPK